MDLQKIKTAIVYDWLDKWGGVERVLLILHELMPRADFFTSYFDEKNASWAKSLTIKTSFMQNFPFYIKKNRILSFGFFPYLFESFQFSDYQLVISVTSSFAKGIITKPGTKHICYLLTPPRYLWFQQQDYLNPLQQIILSPYIHLMKRWDRIASSRPDRIVSISNTVASRCKKAYDRPSDVIYPPFDCGYWSRMCEEADWHILKQIPSKHVYLVVSRIEPYKRVDLAINAVNSKKDYHLVIVGKGSRKAVLQKSAGTNITFLENIKDNELAALYKNAEALIMPQEEDFGYVSLEAQHCGCPVIAYKKGGALETVKNEKTGLFFEKQDVKDLCSALERFEKISYNLKESTEEHGRENTRKFSSTVFKKEFTEMVFGCY